MELLPTLAFTTSEARRCVLLERWDLLIVGQRLAHPGPLSFLASVQECADAPMLVLVDDALPVRPARTGQPLEQLPVDLPAGDVLERAVALLGRGRVEESSMVSWGPLRIDRPRRQAYLGRQPLKLTVVQLRLLETLVVARGAVMTAAYLSESLWGTAGAGDAERLFAHIRRLRQRIEADPAHPTLLLTVRGEGFRLADL